MVQPAAAAVRPLSMADVAARAGVSHQTVSRVINRHPSVAPATRAAGASRRSPSSATGPTWPRVRW